MHSPFEAELEKILADAKTMNGDDTIAVAGLQARSIAAIERAAGRKSVYFERATDAINKTHHPLHQLHGQLGVVGSLLHDIRNGYLRSISEIIHGDVFSDYLEMAEHLASQGYKDPAAVLAGSTLEAHLKQMCAKVSIATDLNGKPKKADQLNSELAAANAYTKLDQKNVTAWLGLRNNAAHGDYDQYDKNQVALLIDSVRNFITRNPA